MTSAWCWATKGFGVSLSVEECLLFTPTFYLPGDALSALERIFSLANNQKAMASKQTRICENPSRIGCGYAALGYPWLNLLPTPKLVIATVKSQRVGVCLSPTSGCLAQPMFEIPNQLEVVLDNKEQRPRISRIPRIKRGNKIRVISVIRGQISSHLRPPWAAYV